MSGGGAASDAVGSYDGPVPPSSAPRQLGRRVVVLGAAGLVGAGCTRDPDPGATSAAVSPHGDVGPTDEEHDAVRAVLDTRATAVVAGDRDVFAGSLADPASAAGARQLSTLAAARALRVSRLEVTHVQVERDEELAEWARVATDVASRVERVYAYFSNFYQGHAPASARHFMRLLGQTPRDPDSLVKQPSLF